MRQSMIMQILSQKKLHTAEKDSSGSKCDFKSARMRAVFAHAVRGDIDSQYEIAAAYWKGSEISQDHSKAYCWYLKAAKQGNPESQCMVGVILDSGDGADTDFNAAFKWFQKSATAGLPWAEYYLGRAYKRGRGTEQDAENAFKWYLKSAKNDIDLAQFEVAQAYEYGSGVRCDMEKAFEWYSRAAKQGNKGAQCSLGMIYAEGFTFAKRDMKKAFSLYMSSAKQGLKQAQRRVGMCYKTGDGVSKDSKKAFEWLLKSAEQGDAEAQYEIACAYDYGEGIKQDKKRAFEWYLKSAEQGDKFAQYCVGDSYENGYGVEEDMVQAYEWYLESAEQGMPLAQLQVGYCYEKGYGTDVDLKEAYQWFLKAAEQGLDNAEIKMGILYDKGTYVKQDKETAFKWYLKAAKKGNAYGEYSVALCYAHGEGVESNDKEFFKWCLKAAEHGHEDAQNRLGIAYDTGKGVAKDKNAAFKWYMKSAEQGVPVAQYNVGVCFENGDGVPENKSSAVQWYLKAAEQGYADAQFELGNAYRIGDGVAADEAVAYKWTLKAAEQGHAVAQNNVGVMLYKGIGVEKDRDAAKKWLEKAAKQGEDCAKEHIREWFEDNDKTDSRVGEKTWQEELAALIGLVPVKKDVDSLASFLQVQKKRIENGLSATRMTNHCVLVGRPGTGKTTVARILARIYHELGFIKTEKFIETDRSGLVEQHIGGTAVKTNKVIDSALDGVLFIDEAYALANGGDQDFGKEAIEVLLKRMEDSRDRLVVILAGYTDEMRKFMSANPGLKSRFARVIEFPDYTANELTAIFKLMAQKEEYILGDGVEDLILKNMKKQLRAHDKYFGNARAVRNFYEEAVRRLSTRLAENLGNLTREDLQTIKICDLGCDDAVQSEKVEDIIRSIDAMIGLMPVKKEIKKLVNFIKAQKAREEMGLRTVPISYHCVFTGNPGTGKTTIARAIGKIYHALGILKSDKFIEVDRSALVAGYVGQTAIKTNDVIDSALDGVLFIDEAYALAAENDKFGKEAIDTLLARMENDRARLVVIVAGYKDEMKKFISSNPGLESRFTRYIDFPDYSMKELGAIFNVFVEKNQFVCGKRAVQAFQKLISDRIDLGDKTFGNGRFVRNCFEKTLEKQAMRVGAMENPSRKDLTEIRVEDLDITKA